METTQVAAATAEVASTTPPLIGQYWPGQGGIYMGLAREDADSPQGHLVLCEVTTDERLKWKDAVAWAKAQSVDGHTDLRLPTRFEAALIYANGQSHVDQDSWHWTGTEDGASYAWHCDFYDGYQGSSVKSHAGSARAVRRFVLQSFNPSIGAQA